MRKINRSFSGVGQSGMMPNNARQDYQYLSDTEVLQVGVGDTGTFKFTIPDGFDVLDMIIFNPEKTTIFTLYSQKLNTNIFEQFNTRIGTNNGIIRVGARAVPNDNLRLDWRAGAGWAASDDLTFSLRFA